MPRAIAPPGGLTLGRAIEIDQEHGAPPTEQELVEYREFEDRMAPVLPKLTASLRRVGRVRGRVPERRLHFA